MFRNQMGIIAAMESADNEGVYLNEVESAELATAVSTETSELQTESTGVDAITAQVEDAVQGSDQLEEIAEVASGAVESGEGMDETAAAMASIAIESIRNRLGFRGVQRLVPALESFGNTNTKLVSTRLVIEGISDTIKEIWIAIKAAAARLWDKIKMFFGKLFNAVELLVKHIDGLKERVNKLPAGLTPKEEKLKSGALATAISVNGVADASTFDKIVANTEKLLATTGEVSQKVREVAVYGQMQAGGITAKGGNAALQFIKGLGDANHAVNVAVGKLGVAEFKEDDIKSLKKSEETKSEGHKVVVSVYGPFAGSSAVVHEKISRTNGEGVTTESFGLSVKSGVGKSAESIKALNQNELMTVLNKAGAIAKTLSSLKKVVKEAEDSTKAMSKAAETVIANAGKSAEKAEDKETKVAMDLLAEMVKRSMAAMNGFSNRAPSIGYAAAQAGAEYVSMSIRNLSAKVK